MRLNKQTPKTCGLLLIGIVIGYAAKSNFVSEAPVTAIKEGAASLAGNANVSGKNNGAFLDRHIVENRPASLMQTLASPNGLQRSRDFLSWLAGINAENWQAEWTAFSDAIKGNEKGHETVINQLLGRIGEVAGAQAMAWFSSLEAQSKPPIKTMEVLSGWAASDPIGALTYFDGLPKSSDEDYAFQKALLPMLIQGTGRHGARSLLDLFIAHSDLTHFGTEFLAALHYKGTVADGDALWRLIQVRIGESNSKASGADDTLFRELANWHIDSASANGTPVEACQWLSGLIGEGFYVDGRSLSNAASTLASTSPENAFHWACDAALKMMHDPGQQHRVASMAGFGAAQKWAENDAEGLSRWLTANPQHVGYESGAAALCKILRTSDPTASAAWGAVVKDGYLRQFVHTGS